MVPVKVTVCALSVTSLVHSLKHAHPVLWRMTVLTGTPRLPRSDNGRSGAGGASDSENDDDDVWKAAVFGALDGVLTSFAVVAGASGLCARDSAFLASSLVPFGGPARAATIMHAQNKAHRTKRRLKPLTTVFFFSFTPRNGGELVRRHVHVCTSTRGLALFQGSSAPPPTPDASRCLPIPLSGSEPSRTRFFSHLCIPITGGGLGTQAVLIVGVSTIVADGLSMGLGEYLSSKAMNEYMDIERKREEWELANHREARVLLAVRVCFPGS